MWQKVVGHKRYYVKWEWCFGHRGASSVTLELACGHTKFQKGSKPIPKRAWCTDHDCGDR